MKSCLVWLACLSTFATTRPLLASESHCDPVPEASLGDRLFKRIAERGRPESTDRPVLRLVYFYAADREPLAQYRERWQRIMDDIQLFYRDEMKRNGYGSTTFDYERAADGTLQIHLVQGRHPSSRYDYSSGKEIRSEVRDAIGGDFDLDTSYTLFIHGLCDELDDGSYRIHAPYYGEGWSNWQGGICHVADCPELDAAFLRKSDKRVRYWEHTGQFDQSLADFNTKYLGGVAHELGHGFGLPHNRQRNAEKRTLGTALMGSGNHTYRREVWSSDRGSFLSLASATRLALHPLFGGFDRQHAIHPSMTLEDGRFSKGETPPTFRGSIQCEVDPIAVVAYADPEAGSDYDAQTVVTEVTENSFELPLEFDRLSDGEFRLLACLANGAVLPLWKAQLETSDGAIDIDSMISRVLVSRVEQLYFDNDRAVARELAQKSARDYPNSNLAAFLNDVAESKSLETPINLAAADSDSVSLDEANWSHAKVGWQKPARSHYPADRGGRAARFISIGGKYFTHGLYAHAPSRYVFDLAGKWKSFKSTIGFQDGAQSEAVWIVIGDGRELMRSKPIGPGRRENRIVDVRGVERLELVIESTRPTNRACWTVWGDPRLTR